MKSLGCAHFISTASLHSYWSLVKRVFFWPFSLVTICFMECSQYCIRVRGRHVNQGEINSLCLWSLVTAHRNIILNDFSHVCLGYMCNRFSAGAAVITWRILGWVTSMASEWDVTLPFWEEISASKLSATV